MANISATEIEDMDLISQLPEPIVHHILCFCSPLELVQMSVLSKKWFRLTASFPFLYFNLSDFEHVSQEVTAFTLRLVTHVFDKRFLKYVEYTTTRFCQHSLTADMLTIITKLYEPAELDIVNRCLELLLQKGVRKLVINITNYSSESPYRLPDVLLSVSVLDSLTIRGCDLPSSFMLDAIKFTSLSKLRLQNVHIDDEAIKYLLQLFEVTACHGFKRFCVHRHQNLQDVWIHYNTPVERIDIDAPNLSTLYITDIDGSGPPQMNLASCEKLTTVIYDARSLSNSNGFTNFLSNFPFVEYLVWAAPHCNNLKLSSHSLRTLELSSQCDLEEIEFNTPNLVSFSYTCSFGGLKSLLRDSSHLKGFMHCYPYNIDTLWFQKLRQFLNKENGFKVFNLYIHATYSQKFTRLEKLKAIELPPYELEHVELQLDTHGKSLVIAFVDAVLWCCRPRSLTLRSSFPLTALEEHSDVVKFTCKKLLEQEDQGHTNIRIVSPSFSSLLMDLPHEGKAISFIKEEVLQEEAGSQRFADLKIV